MKMIHTI